MITFYRLADCNLADVIDEALDDMVIAHKTVTVTDLRDIPAEAKGQPLPVLIDNGEAVSGEQALRARLKELKRIMGLWDKFRSDACYIDDDGTIC